MLRRAANMTNPRCLNCSYVKELERMRERLCGPCAKIEAGEDTELEPPSDSDVLEALNRDLGENGGA